MNARIRVLLVAAAAGLALACLASPTASEAPPEAPAVALPSPQTDGATSSSGPAGTSGSTIPGLASIKVLGVPYSDDDDPAYEGTAVAILFFDANMMGIDFQGVPLTVRVEIYAYSNPVDLTAEEEGDLVYAGEYTIDHSSPPGTHDENFRIPYAETNVDPDVHSPMGRIRVVVETPDQDTFEASMNPVPLLATFQ